MTLPTLLEPLEINHMTLKNRIIFPPMTTGYEARDGSITEQSINFYKRVAEGGASYIVLGDVTPVHTISPTPKLVNDDQIPSFKALADALHEFDCKLGLQVFHPEYDTVAVAELFAKGDMAGARAKLHHDMQHYINEVTGERLQEILGHITALARRATQAGADAIEVHGDRLVGSLCSPLINQRTDEYGGSFENRRPRRSASPATAWSSPPAQHRWPSTPPRLRRTVSRSRWSATATARPRTSTAPWRRATWPPPPPDTPDFVRTLMHRDSDIFHRTAEWGW